MTVGVGIGRAGRPSESRRVANEVLVDLPQRRRAEEGLVVEAGGNEPAERAQQGAGVDGQGGPTVLTARAQALVEKQIGGAGIGLEAAIDPDADQGARLFNAGGENAPGPMVFEAAPHKADAVGQQGRGQGVTRMPLKLDPVKAEGEGFGPVDQPAGRATRAGHSPPPAATNASTVATS